MSHRFGLFAVFITCLSSPVLAQEPTSTVTGSVVDSSNQPISGVVVFVDEGPVSATTGAVGAFRLEGVTSGTYLLHVRKAGFAPRTFNLVFAPNEDRRDLGVIMLEEGPDPKATLTGTVTDGPSGRPLLGAVVELNGEIVTRTDSTGAFGVSDVPIEWGSNEIRVSGNSYAALTSEFWMINPDETFDLSVTLDPVAIEVGGLVVTVERRSTRLDPFYRRQNTENGHFITRSQIEARNPPLLTDILRGVPGVRLRPGIGGIHIIFRRALATQCESPLIFLDGLYTGGGQHDYVSINELASPEQVEGIELYGGVSGVPTELNRTASGCGVIVIWTR